MSILIKWELSLFFLYEGSILGLMEIAFKHAQKHEERPCTFRIYVLVYVLWFFLKNILLSLQSYFFLSTPMSVWDKYEYIKLS